MYCGKCGTQLDDCQTFCQNCGAEIGQVNAQIDLQVKKKYKTEKLIIPIIAVCILAIATGVYFAFFNSFKLEGTYSSLSNGNELYFYYIFTPTSSTDGTYVEKYSKDSTDIENGVYKISNDTVTLTGLFEKKYTIYENYLIATDYLYDGEIPEGETFDITCTYENNIYVFKSDGTFYKQYKDTYGIGHYFQGTYQRNGEIITLNYTDNSDSFQREILVYKNHMVDSVYYKSKG